MKLLNLFNPGVRVALFWIITVVIFGTLLVNRVNLSGDTAYQWINPQSYTDVQGVNIISQLNHWDGVWFTNLSQTGYTYRGPEVMSNVVFFPMYPLAIKLFTLLTNTSPALGSVATSILFTIIGCGLLYMLTKQYATPDRTLIPVYALLAFPSAIFLIAPYSESLFLVLSILFVLLLRRKSYLLAFAVGILASLTRSIGFLLVIFAIGHAWQNWREVKNWKIFLPICIPLGTCAFFIYEKISFGSFFTYLKIESVWGRAFALNWDHLWLGSAAARSQLYLDLGVVIFVCACAAYLIRKKFYAFGLYTVLLVLLPVSTGTLMSVGRYALAAFPIFLIPALVRSATARAAWFFVSILLFSMTAMLFLQNHWAG